MGGTHSQSLALLTRQLQTKAKRRAQTTYRLSNILLTSIWEISIRLYSVKIQQMLNTEKTVVTGECGNNVKGTGMAGIRLGVLIRRQLWAGRRESRSGE